MLTVTFLGTAGSLPTPERNPSAIIVNREVELVLFDCGEGTQRQMMRAKTGMMRLNNIFLSHLHADHILGIPGLMETLAFQGREQPLTIAGPIRTIELVEKFNSISCIARNFEIKTVDLEPGDVIQMKGFQIEALETHHSVPSLGFCFRENQRPGKFNREDAIALGIQPGPTFGKLQHGHSVEIDDRIVLPEQVMGAPRPGRKIVYSGDTRPCPTIELASRYADLLIHDGALAEDKADWARETKHSTAREAAQLAKLAKVRQLVLTHISSRYSEDTAPILENARSIFENTSIAYDLMKLDIKLHDDLKTTQ
ncbi:MAG: ribonuclease Z [Methanotrichaceae archaeon]|nr:ribonuclease Z [Methanotrichaceae archaeon]